MKKRCLIITGGSIQYEFLQEYMKQSCFDLIIAVDGGLKAAICCNIMLDVLIGDFDTIEAETLKHYVKEHPDMKVVRLNPEKDLSDTQSAMEYALKEGVTEIEIVGGVGTRVDHSLANIHVLKKALDQGVTACIVNETNRIYLIKDHVAVSQSESKKPFLSLIPLTTKVTGLTLSGFKYPLQNHTLEIGDSLGISNEIISEDAYITMNEGILIVIESMD